MTDTEDLPFGEFIPTEVVSTLPPSIAAFVERNRPNLAENKLQIGQTNLALQAIADAMLAAFGTTQIEDLSTKLRQPKALIEFSRCLTDYAQRLEWGKTTVYCIGTALRKALILAGVHSSICKRVKISTQKEKSCPILGRRYGKLPGDSPERKLLALWIVCIKRRTRAKTPRSISSMINFFLNSCLPAFGMSLEEWPADPASTVAAMMAKDSSGIINRVTGESKAAGTRFRWLRHFTKHICGSEETYEMTDACYEASHPENEIQAERDVHRISDEDLDKLDTAATGNLRARLQFRIMIMTGMRIGGMVAIKMLDIADISQDKISVHRCARTVEKGQKEFTFYLNTELRLLVKRWIVRGRPASASPYLFPSATDAEGHISTSSARNDFNALCKAAGLSGTEFHPHGLRHSYAHILLEKGHALAKVSLLMGHKDIKTTKVYTKEDAIQRARRMRIDWMDEEDKKEETTRSGPSFMQPPAKKRAKIK